MTRPHIEPKDETEHKQVEGLKEIYPLEDLDMDYEKKSGIVISFSQGIAKVQMRNSYPSLGKHSH